MHPDHLHAKCISKPPFRVFSKQFLESNLKIIFESSSKKESKLEFFRNSILFILVILFLNGHQPSRYICRTRLSKWPKNGFGKTCQMGVISTSTRRLEARKPCIILKTLFPCNFLFLFNFIHAADRPTSQF